MMSSVSINIFSKTDLMASWMYRKASELMHSASRAEKSQPLLHSVRKEHLQDKLSQRAPE